MREIKFRARSAALPPCWIYGYFLISKGSCYIVNKDGQFQVRADTQGQYVGFKDKNDREIWEGDIVWCKLNRGHNGGNYAVTWSDSCAHWRVYATELYQARNIEVIGNIYENPELLEAKQ